MKCRIMPLEKNTEISYRVKCVSVENERVFGDVFVTQQTQDFEYCANCFPHVYKKKKFNLISETLESPDFMQMNRKPEIRRRSDFFQVSRSIQKNIQRSKSVGDEVFEELGIKDLESNEVRKQKVKIKLIPTQVVQIFILIYHEGLRKNESFTITLTSTSLNQNYICILS